MDALDLARWQFGITTVYHFLMVPLTIGLSMIVAWFHTRWYRHGREADLRLTKFFGKLFLINFAMGVVTGIVQEFQFGMNWSVYSRFVGDVFGAPLAMEALVAFFLESTFLGLWIFGWDRLSPKLHLATIWAAAIGTWLSAYFIIAANSWMQHPVGVTYNAETGRAELVDIVAVLTNSTTLAAYPHVIAGSVLTAAVFVAGVSAWYLVRRNPGPVDHGAFTGALHSSLVVTLVASFALVLSGHFQAQLMFEQQPMKMSSAEAHCVTEEGVGLSVFAIGDVSNECDVRSLVIPGLVSFMATEDFGAEIEGVNDLQAQYEETFGPGDYRPNLVITYWSFRAMIGFGLASAAVAAAALFYLRSGRTLPDGRWFPAAIVAVIASPFVANATGWIFTEMGRQPWVVAPNPDGLPEVRLMTQDAVSTSVGAGTVAISLIGFTLVYAALAVVELKLLRTYVHAGPDAAMTPKPSEDEADDDRLTFAY
ncbi:MAG: cytochrome ubiquinol oxidase subunit I [Actinomycetota bacterium]|nr:cytochrome ubiquinol oxidase subunit I [Actinomycetota bacterium]